MSFSDVSGRKMQPISRPDGSVLASVSPAASEVPVEDEDHFPALLEAVSSRFRAVTAGKQVHLFVASMESNLLFDIYLDAFPQARRHHYNCHSCRAFLKRFGPLVLVNVDGSLTSAMWDAERVPALFQAAVRELAAAVVRAPISGVFLAAEQVWGSPQTGSWAHLAVTPAPQLLFQPTPLLTAAQAAAAIREDRFTLGSALRQYTLEQLRQAQSLLAAERLARSEKVLGVARWLVDLKERLDSNNNARAQQNLTWLGAAGAPAGFCHFKGGMLGTLLDDIVAGRAFDHVKARFDAKMDPLKYQRPTAPPAPGNIARAETIVEKLRTAGALERRFAKLSDIAPLWTPTPMPQNPATVAGVFSHLKAGRVQKLTDLPSTVITWEKFKRTVLPEAESIEFMVPSDRASFAALVTAKNPDAPPILQWDCEGARNPVSWYVYTKGSLASSWNLEPGFCTVTAVTLQPYDATKFSHQGERAFFLLQGARDLIHKRGGGFFVESLKSEYHEIRATLEAYMLDAQIAGVNEAEACGIMMQKGEAGRTHTVRVVAKGLRSTFVIDRWD